MLLTTFVYRCTDHKNQAKNHLKENRLGIDENYLFLNYCNSSTYWGIITTTHFFLLLNFDMFISPLDKLNRPPSQYSLLTRSFIRPSIHSLISSNARQKTVLKTTISNLLKHIFSQTNSSQSIRSLPQVVLNEVFLISVELC